MKNVDEKDRQRQTCHRSFNENESWDIRSSMAHLITEAQIQSKDVEEIEDQEDFSNDEMFVNLSIRQTL